MPKIEKMRGVAPQNPPRFFGHNGPVMRPPLSKTPTISRFSGRARRSQLDLGRPFQEKLSCPFDERREIFGCEDNALVPEQISFYFHFRELVVGVDGVAESLIAIQSGQKFDCRYPAKAVMLGRVLRPASAIACAASRACWAFSAIWSR
jgi:hypothetical protein